MKCENCEVEHKGKYGSGRFCSNKCARSFSSKVNREETNKKVSLTLTKEPYNCLCKKCNNEFITKRKNRLFCSKKCAIEYNSKDEQTLEQMSKARKLICSSIDERNRLKEIGRLGGFGTKGYTLKGNYYQSKLEKICFEYLEINNIKFNPHKNLPNDARETDIYLENENIWIELDGINREKRKEFLGKNYNKWKDKIEYYKLCNLNYYIIYTFDEFKKLIENMSH